MSEPHYLRFARSIALVSGLGCAVAGCGMAVSPGGDDAGGSTTDTGGGTTDTGTPATDTGTPIADAGVDAPFDCTTCTCGLTATDAGLPLCTGDAIFTCSCAAVGPLSPPDLPALV